jgi:hypothetical protein
LEGTIVDCSFSISQRPKHLLGVSGFRFEECLQTHCIADGMGIFVIIEITVDVGALGLPLQA